LDRSAGKPIRASLPACLRNAMSERGMRRCGTVFVCMIYTVIERSVEAEIRVKNVRAPRSWDDGQIHRREM
jgi:phage baseplate assembly protein W